MERSCLHLWYSLRLIRVDAYVRVSLMGCSSCLYETYKDVKVLLVLVDDDGFELLKRAVKFLHWIGLDDDNGSVEE